MSSVSTTPYKRLRPYGTPVTPQHYPQHKGRGPSRGYGRRCARASSPTACRWQRGAAATPPPWFGLGLGVGRGLELGLGLRVRARARASVGIRVRARIRLAINPDPNPDASPGPNLRPRKADEDPILWRDGLVDGAPRVRVRVGVMVGARDKS